MSAHAKAVLASLAATVIVAVQAWQIFTVGGFRPVDLLPIATAVVGALLTYVVPNVPELPWAKTVVHGAAAVLTALATFVGSHPSGVTIANVGTVAVFSFLVWYVPELGPLAAPLVEGRHADGQEITDALHALDSQPAATWTRTDLPPLMPTTPLLQATPIADEAQAALDSTAPLAAIPAQSPAAPPVPTA